MVYVILILWKNGELTVAHGERVIVDKFHAESYFESLEKTEDMSVIALHEVPLETSKRIREK